jgi:hypothetical protein
MSRFAKERTQSKPGATAYQNQSIENVYLSLKRTQYGLIGMLVACSILGMTVLKPPVATLSNRIFLPIIFSTSLLVFAFTIRNSMVVPSLAELRRNPLDPKALKLWGRNNVIVQCLCGAVGLLGFATQLLGAATSISLTLYAIAVVYLFLLQPAKP